MYNNPFAKRNVKVQDTRWDYFGIRSRRDRDQRRGNMCSSVTRPTLDVTVCLCTWNRASSLGRTLNSLARMRIPPGMAWEVLVVDNGCTDHTAKILRRHQTLLPLRAVIENQPGIAHARTLGLAEARGDLILWTDDDVEVDAHWVAAYVDAARDYPDAAFWGGRIDPSFEAPLPDWLEQAWPVVASIYGERVLGENPVEIRELAQMPFGANYAARTAVHRRYPYNMHRGRCRDRYIGGEETFSMQNMLRDGYRAWWLPNARIVHWIPPNGTTLEYVGRYWRGAGENSEMPNRSVFTVLNTYSRAILMEGQFRLQRLLSPPDVWLRTFLRAQYHWGRCKRTRTP